MYGLADGKVQAFLDAQAHPTAGWAAALAELREGAKKGHWIWYIFPQVHGLGRSEVALRFALEDADEACDYALHPTLGPRLLSALQAVAACDGTLAVLMGGPLDARKLVSSLTLFAAAGQLAARLPAGAAATTALAIADQCEALLHRAAEQGLPPCAYTQRLVPARP